MKWSPILLIIAAGAAVWYFMTRKTSLLGEHLQEQANLQTVGRLAQNASMAARPAVQTYSNRGPLDGAQVSLIDTVLFGVPDGQDTIFRPTLSGDETTLLPEDY